MDLVCVVEVTKGARNKDGFEPELGGIVFDRLLMTVATYPADYGFLRGTLGRDGDPLDALVCLSEPTFPGCLVPVKPLGLFRMHEEEGSDDEVTCVPRAEPYWNGYEVVDRLPQLLRQEIEQFCFSIDKQLEQDKTVAIDGWGPSRTRSRRSPRRSSAIAPPASPILDGGLSGRL